MTTQDRELLAFAQEFKRKYRYATVYTYDYDGELVLTNLNERKEEIERLRRQIATDLSLIKSQSLAKRCTATAFNQARQIVGDIFRATEDESAAIKVLRHKYHLQNEKQEKERDPLLPLLILTSCQPHEIISFLVELIDTKKLQGQLNDEEEEMLGTIRTCVKPLAAKKTAK